VESGHDDVTLKWIRGEFAMPSIKTIATAYEWGNWFAFFGAVYVAQTSWIAAGILMFGYALAGPTLLKCPRCGLATSGRIRTDRKGQERRSRMHHSSNPNDCSRCGLNFRTHSFADRFD
jgi:uncharacterized C2H2 Zn-finger protein